MEAEFWHERWRLGDPKWNQTSPNRVLQRHWSVLGCPPGTSVFVPLCGTSIDMVWLVSNGHRVVGCELSEYAVGEFLAGVDAPVERRSEPPFTVSSAGPYELWVGDIFDLPGAVVDGVDAVYDRASLVALSPELRRRYADHLSAILPERASIFLLSLDYDPTEMQGPPFSVPVEEIHELFPAFEAETIVDEDALADNADLAERGLSTVRHTLTVLRRAVPGQTR